MICLSCLLFISVHTWPLDLNPSPAEGTLEKGIQPASRFLNYGCQQVQLHQRTPGAAQIKCWSAVALDNSPSIANQIMGQSPYDDEEELDLAWIIGSHVRIPRNAGLRYFPRASFLQAESRGHHILSIDQSWPEAAPRNCPLPVVQNGNSHCRLESCIFSCPTGFSRIGASNATCLGNGQWSSPLPVCEPVHCPEITLANGHITCKDWYGDWTYGSACSFSCQTNYTLEGSHHTVCWETSQWSSSPPSCKVSTTNPAELDLTARPLIAAPPAPPTTVHDAIITAAVLGMIACVNCVKRKKRKRKRSFARRQAQHAPTTSNRPQEDVEPDRIAHAYEKTIQFLEESLHSNHLDQELSGIYAVTLQAIQVLYKRWRDLEEKPRTSLPKLPPREGPVPVLMLDDLHHLEPLGKGREAKVFKALLHGKPVVLKKFRRSYRLHMRGAQELWGSFIPHPNVATLLGVVPNYGLVSRYRSHGSLQTFSYSLDGGTLLRILQQVCRGLAHLHRQNLVHLDLALRNILMEHLHVELTDFGLSMRLQNSDFSVEPPNQNGGISIEMLAPEICLARVKREKHTVSARRDMWSFAVVIWELVMRRPFAMDEEDVRTKIQNGTILPAQEIIRKVGVLAPQIIVALIGCKQEELQLRLTAQEARVVLGDPWTPSEDEELQEFSTEVSTS